MEEAKKKDPKKVLTPEFVASFVQVFRPKGVQGDTSGKQKYSVVMLFKKGEDLSKLKAAAQLAAKEKWGDTLPKKLRNPFKDQGEKAGEYAGFNEGAIYIQASTETRPGLVNANREEIIEEEEFYSGCYARATINAYAWEHPTGGKGVSFGLHNLQKLRDGERLGGGRAKAEDDFDAVVTDEGSNDLESVF